MKILNIKKNQPFRVYPLNMRQSSDGVSLVIAVAAITMGIIIVLLQLLVARPSQISMYQKAQNSTFARYVALSAMARARDQMQILLNGGTSLPVGYNWTGNISTPDNPNNLSGSSTIIGTYTATVAKKSGNFYLLAVTSTVNGVQETVYKLIEVVAASQLILDKVPNALAAYSLRKLRTGYSGAAVKVSPVDSAGAITASTADDVDIGFNASGDLDITALATTIGLNTAPPLDTVTSAAAAYSLRKLRTAYTGPAIQVRRSSDNGTQDIGFDANGDLDTAALTTFVGNANDGFVSKWYDQSGNTRDLITAGSNNQPVIFDHTLTGTKVIMENSRPAIYFDGVTHSSAYRRLMYSTSSAINTTTISAYMVGRMVSGGTMYGILAAIQCNSDANDYSTLTSSQLLAHGSGTTQYGLWLNNTQATRNLGWESTIAYSPNNTNNLFQATSVYTGSQGRFTFNGGATATVSASTNFSINRITIGQEALTNVAGEAWQGKVSEVILYTANHSTANQTLVKKNQSNYYQIYNAPMGRITKWYDQSGNGKDLTLTSGGNPPIVMLPKPALAFLDSPAQESTLFGNSSLSFSGSQLSAFTVSMLSEYSPGEASIVSMYASGGANDSDTFFIGEESDGGYQPNAYTRYMHNARQCGDPYIGIITLGQTFQLSTEFNGSTAPLRTNGTLGSPHPSYCGGTGANTGSWSAQQLYVGNWNSKYWAGTISEVILYAYNPSMPTVEADQKNYFGTP